MSKDKQKADAIHEILETNNGSHYDIADEAYDKGFEHGQSPTAPQEVQPEADYVLRTIDTNNFYWCKCKGCGWEDSSDLLEGGGAIGDTGDYFDVTCPVCGCNDLDGEPTVDVPQYEGVQQVKIPYDVYMEPYKKAAHKAMDLEFSKHFATMIPAQEVQPGKNKPFIAANIREIMDQYPDSISFQRMVELFNEVADKFYNQEVQGEKESYTTHYLDWRNKFFDNEILVLEYKSKHNGTRYSREDLHEKYEKAMLESPFPSPPKAM